MHAKLRHGQRGQAIVETVLFLPLFLLALFGVIWAVKAAVQYERVESAVRYAGLISQRANPYVDYSLYSMYTQLGSQTIPTLTCNMPPTAADPLSDAAPTYSSSRTVTASAPFWSPASAQPSCPLFGLVGFPAGTGLAQDVILNRQKPGIISRIPVPGPLVSVLTPLTSAEADENFFRPPGVNVILACYPFLEAEINSSLRYTTDTAQATPPAVLSSVVTPMVIPASANCTTL